MVTYAETGDVEAALLRPLTIIETPYVAPLLERALRIILRTVSSYGREVTELDEGAIRDVQADMVARVLRNPSGFRSESDGQYSYQLDTASASGRLELTHGDLVTLGLVTDTNWWVWHPQYGTVPQASNNTEVVL